MNFEMVFRSYLEMVVEAEGVDFLGRSLAELQGQFPDLTSLEVRRLAEIVNENRAPHFKIPLSEPRSGA